VLASADYRLTSDNELVMVFSATTDKPTPINVSPAPCATMRESWQRRRRAHAHCVRGPFAALHHTARL